MIKFTKDIENVKLHKRKRFAIFIGTYSSKIGFGIKVVYTKRMPEYREMIDENIGDMYFGWGVERFFYNFSIRKIHKKDNFRLFKSCNMVVIDIF